MITIFTPTRIRKMHLFATGLAWVYIGLEVKIYRKNSCRSIFSQVYSKFNIHKYIFTGSSVFRGGMRPCPPSESPKTFLTRYTVKNGISSLYILLKSVLIMQGMPFQRPKFQNGISNLYILFKRAFKMQEMPFQRPKFQKNSGGGLHAPGPPYNCVVTMASPH